MSSRSRTPRRAVGYGALSNSKKVWVEKIDHLLRLQCSSRMPFEPVWFALVENRPQPVFAHRDKSFTRTH